MRKSLELEDDFIVITSLKFIRNFDQGKR